MQRAISKQGWLNSKESKKYHLQFKQTVWCIPVFAWNDSFFATSEMSRFGRTRATHVLDCAAEN